MISARVWGMLVVMVAMAAFVVGRAQAQGPWRPGPGPEPKFVPQELLVFPTDPGQARELATKLHQNGFLVLGRGPLSGMILAAVPAPGLERPFCEWLRAWPEIRAVEQNMLGEPTMQPACPVPATPVQNPCNTGGATTPFPTLYATSCPSAGVGLPNDPYFCYQWGLRNTGQVVRDRACSIAGQPCWEMTGVTGVDIGVVEAWERTTGSPHVTVAILDSGIEYCNPDFDPSRFFYPDLAFTCIGSDAEPYPCCPTPGGPNEEPCNFGLAADNYGHGTLVASVLGATTNNAIGIAGVDHNCKIMSVRVAGTHFVSPGQFISANVGRATIALETIAASPIWDSVRVINMSFKMNCAFLPSEQQVTAFESAVTVLRQQNRFVVTTSTNDGVGAADLNCPNSFADAITVGGIDARGWRSVSPPCPVISESGTGSSLDFVAPGMGMAMLVCQSNPCPSCPYPTAPCISSYGYNFLNGTSFAAPQVCGAISLILARAIDLGIVNHTNWQGLTWDQVYDLLKRGARDRVSWEGGLSGDPNDVVGWDSHYGWGLIDIEESLFWLEELYCPPCQ